MPQRPLSKVFRAYAKDKLLEILSFLNHWLLLPQVWLIIGMLLVLMELMDGSQIFFLPIGLGGILTSAALYLERKAWIPFGYIPDTWYGMLVFWAIASLVFILLLTIRRRKQKKSVDVNDY